jgi:LPPG:FO 2-phospho-L-lactate transferase
MSHVTVLSGGSGGAKFLVGLVDVLPEEEVQVIVNIADDYETCGLYVSPDVDGILYALAGELDPARGWTRPNETYNCRGMLRKLGIGGVGIGDHDLAIHLLRTSLIKSGASLESVTSELADRFGVGARILPASNDPIRTRILDGHGSWGLSEWIARSKNVNGVTGVIYEGAATASAPESVVASILEASRVIVAPSDPVLSIGSILAVPGIREALSRTEAGVVAISPVVGRQAVNGNASELMRVTGSTEVSARAVAERYRDFLDTLVIHTTDVSSVDSVRETGVDVWVESILINDANEANRLAARVTNPARTVAKP